MPCNCYQLRIVQICCNLSRKRYVTSFLRVLFIKCVALFIIIIIYIFSPSVKISWSYLIQRCSLDILFLCDHVHTYSIPIFMFRCVVVWLLGCKLSGCNQINKSINSVVESLWDALKRGKFSEVSYYLTLFKTPKNNKLFNDNTNKQITLCNDIFTNEREYAWRNIHREVRNFEALCKLCLLMFGIKCLLME